MYLGDKRTRLTYYHWISKRIIHVIIIIQCTQKWNRKLSPRGYPAIRTENVVQKLQEDRGAKRLLGSLTLRDYRLSTEGKFSRFFFFFLFDIFKEGTQE